MKLTLGLLVATIVSFVAAQAPANWRFTLQAATYRFTQPSLSGPVDLDSNGLAGFNRTKVSNYAGFVSYMTPPSGSNPLPIGPLTKEAGHVPGYLKPTRTPGLYDFYFGRRPHIDGILYKKFAITVLNCGGNCGGLKLEYDPALNPRWMAYPDRKVPTGWKIQYWKGQGEPPAGGHAVWLLRWGV